MANKKKISKKSRKPRPKRKYDNSSRAEKSEQTQKAIIEALVELLVERKGDDVQISEIAKRTGIAQRTIFRFFKDKKSLHEAMNYYLMSYLAAGAEQMEALNFAGFGKNAFLLFDKHEGLTIAYVLSRVGLEIRTLFRKQLIASMIDRIRTEKNLSASSEMAPSLHKKIAFITSLVNAKLWYDIKTDHGLNGAEISETVEWALTTLLDNLDQKR